MGNPRQLAGALALGVAAAVASVSTASAVTYKVEADTTGDGMFDTFLGSVTPFMRLGQTTEDFYDLPGNVPYTYRGDIPVVDDGITSFLVVTNDGLSFISTIDSPATGSGQKPTATVNLEVTGFSGIGPDLLESDDTGEFDETSTNGVFAGGFEWQTRYGDGFAIGPLDGAFELVMDFTLTSGTFGAAGWTVKGDGQSFNADADAIKISAVPVPAGVLLVASAFALAAGVRARARASFSFEACDQEQSASRDFREADLFLLWTGNGSGRSKLHGLVFRSRRYGGSFSR